MSFRLNHISGIASGKLLIAIALLLLVQAAYAQPANNNCSGAISLSVNSDDSCTQQTSVMMPTSATASTMEVSCLQNGNLRDLWYSFTATSRTHFIQATGFSGTSLGAASPAVILALYSGACANLAELFCSMNNGILASNLEPGETYFLRVVVDEASASQFSFNLCVNTITGSMGGSAACPIFTINSGVEEPILPEAFSFVHQNRVLGWRTTASDELIEFWRDDFLGVPAYEGDQFAELNATQASALYQDYDTPFAVTFNYSFAHRGRSGTDVCRVRAGPPGGPYTTVVQVSTGNTAWQLYTGSFDIPTGQPVTRIFFEAVSATGGTSVGNFLDAVNFEAQFGVTSATTIERCLGNTATEQIIATGLGNWRLDDDNPAPLTIGDPFSDNTTVSGFTLPGYYYIYWENPHCTDIIEVLVKPCGAITNPSIPSGKGKTMN